MYGLQVKNIRTTRKNNNCLLFILATGIHCFKCKVAYKCWKFLKFSRWGARFFPVRYNVASLTIRCYRAYLWPLFCQLLSNYHRFFGSYPKEGLTLANSFTFLVCLTPVTQNLFIKNFCVFRLKCLHLHLCFIACLSVSRPEVYGYVVEKNVLNSVSFCDIVQPMTYKTCRHSSTINTEQIYLIKAKWQGHFNDHFSHYKFVTTLLKRMCCVV